MSEQLVCGICNYYDDGLCVASGWLGCSDEDLLKVELSQKACDSFEEESESSE